MEPSGNACEFIRFLEREKAFFKFWGKRTRKPSLPEFFLPFGLRLGILRNIACDLSGCRIFSGKMYDIRTGNA